MSQVNRYLIDNALEEWRDDCVEAGIDYSTYLVLYDDNLRKDLARHLMWRINESIDRGTS